MFALRFLSTLKKDIRYQIKYGFYFIYTFVSLIYFILLHFIPLEYKTVVATFILVSDPAALGFVFIGGIWLLEKSEGIHLFLNTSPLKAIEYVSAKAMSLAIISTLSALLISLFGLPLTIIFWQLALGIFICSLFFTLFGLFIATFARSVNHYMLIVIIPSLLFALPLILVFLGYDFFILELFPTTAIWRVIYNSIEQQILPLYYLLTLVVWTSVATIFTTMRINTLFQRNGGKK